MAIKQTAGRDALGEFAAQFAQLNDDVLFGQVWAREEELSARDRSLVTVTALMAQGLTDPSFQYHLMSARQNGITRPEIAEILTHAAFTPAGPKRGRPSAWQRRSGRKMPSPGTQSRPTPMPRSSPSGPPTTVLPLTSPDRAIWLRSPPARWGSFMSHLSRDAGTTGTSTTPSPAADKFCSAPPGGAAIRNGDSPPGNCAPEMWSTFRQASNTGTARPRTAGSPIWR